MPVYVEKVVFCRWILTTGTSLDDPLPTVEDSLLFRDAHRALDHRHEAFDLVIVGVSDFNDAIYDLAGEANRYEVRADLYKLLHVFRRGLEL